VPLSIKPDKLAETQYFLRPIEHYNKMTGSLTHFEIYDQQPVDLKAFDQHVFGCLHPLYLSSKDVTWT
jgi:hypothetical protein